MMHGLSGSAAAGTLPPLPSHERLQTLLFDACRLGRCDVIPALIAAGADIEAKDAKGHSPLVLATYYGHENAAALLLDNGALPDGDAAPSASGSALMGAAFKGYGAIARLLLDKGANPDFRNAAGQTALMMAALFDRREIIVMLRECAADPDVIDLAGNTAASLAGQQGNDLRPLLYAGKRKSSP